jgi:hypothetical protein
MAKAPTANQNAGGRHSAKNQPQDDLRDEGHGAYDPAGNQNLPDTNQQTEHERAQTGADVRGDPIPTEDFELPEGLRRQRTGPYDRDRGRDNEPRHVSGPKGGRT